MNNFSKWIIHYRWFIIVTTLVLGMGVSSGLRHLQFTSDNRVFFGEQNPELKALEQLENIYSRKYNVLFIVAPQDGDVFTRQTLVAIEELTQEAWQIPFSSRTNSISNFQYTQSSADELVIEDLFYNALNLSDAELETRKSIALSEPLLVNKIISASGHVSGVNVNILLPGESADEVVMVADYSRNLTAKFQTKYPNIDFMVTGALMLDNAFNEVTKADMSVLVPSMFVVLLFITGVFLRSFYGTLCSLVVILLSMFTALGIVGWTGIPLNPASVNAPTIILTLAIADSVHIIVTLFHYLRQGYEKNCAIMVSIQENFKPVFLTSITTVIGFLSMNFSDAPPFRELGNIVALGITAAFLYSILLLPAMMSVLPLKYSFVHKRANYWGMCDKLADFVITKYKAIFTVTLASIVVLTFGLMKIELDEDFIKYFSENYEVRTTGDFMEQHLTGADIIEFSLDSGESGGINNPEYLAKIDEFARWYRQQEKVVHVAVFSDTMKRLNKNMHNDEPDWYAIPNQRDLAAQYLLLYEMSLPMGMDLNNVINVDKSSTRITIMVKDATTNEQRSLDEKGQAWLRENAPEHMHAVGTGLSILWAHLTKRTINTMLLASLGALVLISFILIFALQSVKYGLLSLVPNLIPVAMAFGIWGLFVGRVGLGLSVVVSMSLGIVVDDTVHFINKYLHNRHNQGMDTFASIRDAFNTVGEAMTITTVALVAGFLILIFSDYRMNAEMGLMTAITIFLALLVDFFFLPSLLIRMDSKNRKAEIKNIKHSHQGYAGDY